ncbi:hypothetical protein BDZ45DRAFT_708489 [Acephala macrosclerotiorum]|nr:hypothetical protein BDZ45DRAFT_708489 [Acephala macrosclerotiorum]
MYLCNLNTMLFGLTAGFSMLTDGKVEMPCHHTLWDSSNAEEWRLLASSRGYSSLLQVKDAVSRLLNGTYSKDVPEQFWSWDPYSCNVAVNAVSIYISHMVQGSHFLGEVPLGAEESSTQRSVTTNQMETAISRCLLLIKNSRARADDSYTWDEAEGPLLFNSLALLRVSYCKVMTRAESAGRAMFFREDEADFESSIETFLHKPLEWNLFLTRTVSVALESIMMPAKIGTLLVRKTAAFTWAIEHAFSSWDSILLLTKWLYAIEQRKGQGFTLQDAERQIVEKVLNMLTEESDLITTEQCLAAALARFWAGIYDEVWVWGVTPKMGAMLRELANHYDARASTT